MEEKEITVYHGTDEDSAESIEHHIDLSYGQEHVDFGKGFYVTENQERAKAWAKRKARLRGKRPALVCFMFDKNGTSSIIQKFENDLEWGRFVINNRNGYEYINKVEFKLHNIDAKFDITYGRIADLSVGDVADELLDSGEMLNSLDEILNVFYPMQYAFHTERSLEFLTFKKIVHISL